MEDGPGDSLGDWLSRELGIKTPPIAMAETAQFPGGGTKTIRLAGNPMPLAGTRRNEEEHQLVFHFSNKESTTGMPQLIAIPFDKAAIIAEGYGRFKQIPLDPSRVQFQARPCPMLVDIHIEKSLTTWLLEPTFRNQQVEVMDHMTTKEAWGELR
jgi:hypothetical protein